MKLSNGKVIPLDKYIKKFVSFFGTKKFNVPELLLENRLRSKEEAKSALKRYFEYRKTVRDRILVDIDPFEWNPGDNHSILLDMIRERMYEKKNPTIDKVESEIMEKLEKYWKGYKSHLTLNLKSQKRICYLTDKKKKK